MSRILRITPTQAERTAGAFGSETIRTASSCMRTDGALIIEDILDVQLLENARTAFLDRYEQCFDGSDSSTATQVGGSRLMITLDLEPPFDKRELFANPWIGSLLRAAFDSEFLIDSYGVVCALPGAPAQHVHQDGGDIFPQAALNGLLPIFAATVAIPLVEMNEISGTTALYPGSHRAEALASTENLVEPVVRLGSCIIWDYRLRHGGTPNRGSRARPLLYMTCCCPWFIDHKNYRNQVALRVPRRLVAELPEDLRRLLTRAQLY